MLHDMKTILQNLCILSLVILLPFQSLAKEDKTKKNKKIIESEAGLNIPEWGIAIDAIYDNRLDDLLPGYKILNVVVTNRATAPLSLDPIKDQWTLHNHLDKKIRAINHLRLVDEKLWDSLPVGLKSELDYPQIVRVGHTAKIDLLFRDSVDLNGFRSLEWVSNFLKKTFIIHTALEKNLEWEHKEEPIPQIPAKPAEPDPPAEPSQPQNNIPKLEPPPQGITIPMD